MEQIKLNYLGTLRDMVVNPRVHVFAYILIVVALISHKIVLIVLAAIVAPFIDGWVGNLANVANLGRVAPDSPAIPRNAESFTGDGPDSNAGTSVADRRTPTSENPFMNYQLDEITNNAAANKPDAFAQNNATLRPEMEAQYGKLASAHIDDEGDIWGRKYSSWAFYTIPGNSPVRDPDGTYQNWLYGQSFPTCKEDVRFCAIKPPRTETPSENAIQDRTVAFGIGLDMNTNRRVAAGVARGQPRNL